MRRGTRGKLGWLLGLGLLALVACRTDEGVWPQVVADGVLRVGVDPTFPPFELADAQGQVTGLDVDLAQALGEELGLNVTFVFFGYDGLYDALSTQQADVLLSALTIQPERTRDFAYSAPYFNDGLVLMVAEGETAVTGMADLAGRSLAVELGAQGHVEAMTWTRRLANLTVQPYPTTEDALTAVAQQKATAALVDGVNGRLYQQTHPGLRRLSPSVTTEPYALVVRVDDAVLLNHLNEALARLEENGRLAEIVNHWLGP